MGGHPIPVVMKPSRSDEVLDPDEQLQIALDISARFESLTPKRPLKPNRSEPDSSPPPHQPPAHHDSIPELHKLLSLRSQLQPVIPNGGGGGGGVIEQEFVETSYYEGLIAIDKQHHTTGTGFIRVGAGDDDDDEELPAINPINREREVIALGLRGNPAMNDWTPNFDDDQAYESSKPVRSG